LLCGIFFTSIGQLILAEKTQETPIYLLLDKKTFLKDNDFISGYRDWIKRESILIWNVREGLQKEVI